jgi:hypothetical protein
MNEFDKYVKDSLYSYESPVPEGLWERIVADNEKRKPNAVPFWKNGYFQASILAIVAIGMISGGFIYSRKDGISASAGNKTETIASVVANGKTSSNDNSEHLVSKNNLLDDKKAKQSINDEHIIANEKKPITNAKNSLVNVKDVHKSLETFNSKGSDIKPLKNINDGINKEISTPATTLIKDAEVVNKPEKYVVATTVTDNNDQHYFERGTIVTHPINLSNDNLVSKTLQGFKETNKTVTTIHLPQINDKSWYVEFYSSPDYDIKKVSANGVNPRYLHTLDTTQKLTGGFTFGFRVAKSINNHFKIKSGLQFKDVTQQFNYQQYTTKTITVTSTNSYINNNGVTVIQTTSSSYLQDGYKLMKRFNNYSSIEVPMIASWETGKNKWHFAADGGLILNLASFYQGETFDASLNNVPLSAKKPNGIFKSNISSSLYGGLSFLYNLGKDFDGFIEPYYEYGLSNSSRTTIGFGERFNSIGINFGIRYKIPYASIKK